MRLRNLLGIALGFRLLVGCHRAVEPRPPIARVCAANRILERSRGARVLELAAVEPVRVRIERTPRAGLIAGLCPGRLLDDPDRRVAIGDLVRCADRTLLPPQTAVR